MIFFLFRSDFYLSATAFILYAFFRHLSSFKFTNSFAVFFNNIMYIMHKHKITPPRHTEAAHFILFFLILELGNYPHKAVHIIEIPVNAGKSYICNRVYFLQLMQHHLADLIGSNLSLERILQFRSDLFHHIFELIQRYRTLYSRAAKPFNQFFPVERLNGMILLNYHQGHFFYYFISCETEPAVNALAAAAHLVFRWS